MQQIELVADADVISFMFRRGPLGEAYSQLIGASPTGITWLTLAESRLGVVYDNWGARKVAALHSYLSRFFVLEANAEIANICGGLLGRCKQIGRAVSWPDAWAAATAMWLDVPLVAHDRDLESPVCESSRFTRIGKYARKVEVSAQEGHFGSASAASGIAGRARIVSRMSESSRCYGPHPRLEREARDGEPRLRSMKHPQAAAASPLHSTTRITIERLACTGDGLIIVLFSGRGGAL